MVLSLQMLVSDCINQFETQTILSKIKIFKGWKSYDLNYVKYEVPLTYNISKAHVENTTVNIFQCKVNACCLLPDMPYVNQGNIS